MADWKDPWGLRLLVDPGTMSLFRPVCGAFPSEIVLGDGRAKPGSIGGRGASVDASSMSYWKVC